MDQAQKLRDNAACFIRYSKAISNRDDIAHFLALADEAVQAAAEMEFADAARLERGQAAAD
jgi:hypothetical protein